MSLLTAEQVEQVSMLVDAATKADGVPPLNEAAVLHLKGDAGHFLHYRDDVLVGYAQLHEGSAELVVHPESRRRGIGLALGRELLTASHGRLRIWAHGEHPGARPLAMALGLERSRLLWKFHLPLPQTFATPHFPDDLVVRPFQVGHDNQAWLDLNSRAFADHPEQGTWTAQDLAARFAEPWFDPNGFFLATRNNKLLGYHWTKAHSPQLGEIYVLGIDPTAHGHGLGRALALVGLRYLQARGHTEVILYVEADNTAAVHLYRKLGFTLAATDSEYSSL